MPRQPFPATPCRLTLAKICHAARRGGRELVAARARAVTLIQRFRGALNLNPHFHMLFLDGIYVEGPGGSLTFRWVEAPTSAELSALAGIASRVDAA